MTCADIHCYATRLLNPFQGVALIAETDKARAITTDGINWRIQIRSEIYKTPWSSLAIPTNFDRFFVFGVWSQQEGLARVPIHPSLYQDHVETAAHYLLEFLLSDKLRLPFALVDSIELWIMDAENSIPVALIASLPPGEDIPPHKQLHWYPTQNMDVPFTSHAYAAEQKKATIKVQTQDLLLRSIRQRCKFPYQALWIERLKDGSGRILYNHRGRSMDCDNMLPPEVFPQCLLTEKWQNTEDKQLVADYINWQAPILLMLPLSQTRRRHLEHHAQQRPLAVHQYHRLYPDVCDQGLINKILVEAVMRKAAKTD